MVQFNPYKDVRHYPPLPLPQRLQLWLDRVDRKTRHFKRPRQLLLRRKLAEELSLSSNVVELDQAGVLRSGSTIIASTGD